METDLPPPLPEPLLSLLPHAASTDGATASPPSVSPARVRNCRLDVPRLASRRASLRMASARSLILPSFRSMPPALGSLALQDFVACPDPKGAAAVPHSAPTPRRPD